MTDEQIIQLFQNRDERAIEEISKKYKRYYAHIASKVLDDFSDVEECINDTWLGVWNAIPPATPDHLNLFLARIVCDRGMMDNRAYLTNTEFQTVIDRIGESEVAIRDRYDAVFHLVTAANGAPDIYLKHREDNPARTETVERAVELDNRLISAWTGHPHFRVIDNSTGFENKMKRLISEIAGFLGEPEPYEIERKFLIEYPDICLLEKRDDCQKVEIIQTYLKAGENEEVRVRQRGAKGSYIYFKTTKKKITDTIRIEMEDRLTQEEYLKLLMEADTSMHQIRKTRYCLTFESQYFEIDIYPFWQDRAIVEIELLTDQDEIKIPEFLKVIREVTDDDAYKNASLARR